MRQLHGAVALLVLACAVAVVHAGEDYYGILGVSNSADEAQIKRAFRKLSLKYHPDKCKGSNCEEMFMKASKAYEVLSDVDKRRVYDQFGEDGLEQQAQRRNAPRNPFASFFGFGGGGGGEEEAGPERGPDVKISLRVTLQDLYSGRTLHVHTKKQELCPRCRGSGARSHDDIQKCAHCNGHGVRLVRRQLGPGFVQEMQIECDRCGGTGRIVKHHCPVCGGGKVVPGEEELEIIVERGMPDGHAIVFEHKADARADKAPGHLIFAVHTVPHDLFAREGNNLRAPLRISLLEALTGFEREFEHLDGHKVTVRRGTVTRPGDVIRVEEEGMPHHNFPSQRGDLLLDVEVHFPESLSEQQRQALRDAL